MISPRKIAQVNSDGFKPLARIGTWGQPLFGDCTNALLSDDTLVAEKLYEPNGVPTVLLPEHMSVDDFTYTGRSYIPELDLHYYRGRYMSLYSNRFTQQDPMQHGSNWYAYTANPVMMVDPTGYAFKDFYDPAMEEILSIFDIKQVGYGLILEQILKFAGPFGTLYTIYNTSVAGYELYQNWGCMTPEQYHAFAGRLVGGKIKDAILGRAKLQAGTLARKGWNRLKSSFRRQPSIGSPSSMGLLPDGKKGSPKKKKKTADGKVRFKRWKRGERIDKPLPDGSEPSWKTVKERYWRNRYEASKHTDEFSPENLRRMNDGNAPQDFNPRTGEYESRELHHVVQRQYGGDNSYLNLRELTPDWHAEVDAFRHVDGIETIRGIR